MVPTYKKTHVRFWSAPNGTFFGERSLEQAIRQAGYECSVVLGIPHCAFVTHEVWHLLEMFKKIGFPMGMTVLEFLSNTKAP